MVFLVIAVMSGVLALIDVILDRQYVELLVGKKKEIDLIGKFQYIGFVLFLVFGLVSVVVGGDYVGSYRELIYRQEAISEQYLMSDKTKEDWHWVCTELHAINEEMKELDESKEQRQLWDFTAFFASNDYKKCSAVITEMEIRFDPERHLIPLHSVSTD